MTTTGLIPRITASACLNDEVGRLPNPLVDELVTIILGQREPVTVWEVATKLGDGYAGQASAILNGLTANGLLARFKSGFNNYYASPKVALTSQKPTLRTIISDSFKRLFLSCRYKVMQKLRETNKCSRAKWQF